MPNQKRKGKHNSSLRRLLSRWEASLRNRGNRARTRVRIPKVKRLKLKPKRRRRNHITRKTRTVQRTRTLSSMKTRPTGVITMEVRNTVKVKWNGKTVINTRVTGTRIVYTGRANLNGRMVTPMRVTGPKTNLRARAPFSGLMKPGIAASGAIQSRMEKADTPLMSWSILETGAITSMIAKVR